MPALSLNEDLIWRTAGGNPARRGLFPQALRLRPRPVRRLVAEGALQAAVVFDERGSAYVADMAGTVQAFAAHGRRRWRAALPGAISATPVVHPTQPRLYVGTHAGWCCALDTDNGATFWRAPVPTTSDPRIVSDLLFWSGAEAVVLSSWGGRFVALEAATGTVKFSWDAGYCPASAATADAAGQLYCLRAVPGLGLELVRVSPRGEEGVLHRLPEDARGARRALVAAAPVLDETRARLYFVANRERGGLLGAWSLRTDELVWTRPLDGAVQVTPTVRQDGAVLLADLRGVVHGYSPEGQELFRYSPGSDYWLAGGVCDADGDFFIGDPLGRLHVVGREGTGQVVFEASRAVQARPSFSPEGRLFLPVTDRRVHVFATQPAAA